jgi:hypothetical protein
MVAQMYGEEISFIIHNDVLLANSHITPYMYVRRMSQ